MKPIIIYICVLLISKLMVSAVVASPIYIDEENHKQLTFDSPDKYNPVFSPDGSKIAYITQIHYTPGISNSYDWSLWVMDSDGSNQKKIFDNLISRTVVNEKLTKYKVHIGIDLPPSFSWNNESNKILISRHIIDLNSNYFMFKKCPSCGGRGSLDDYTDDIREIVEPHDHYEEYFASSWSKEGKILFSDYGKIFVLDSLDKEPRELMKPDANRLIWKPDGKKFALEGWGFHIIDIDTLTDNKFDIHRLIAWAPNEDSAIIQKGEGRYLLNFKSNESFKLNFPYLINGISLNADGTKIAYIGSDNQVSLSNISSVRIDIQSNPSDSEVYIDNKSQVIKTPNYFYSNPGNIHRLKIKKSGYEEWGTIFRVNSSWGSIINLTVNLTLKDSDNDGWADKKELEMGTDPNKKDTDNDGLLDSDDPNPTVFDAKKTEPLNKNYLIAAGMFGLVIIGIVTRPAIKRYYLKRKLKQTPTDWCPYCHKFSGSSSICPHCGKETLVYIKYNIKNKNK